MNFFDLFICIMNLRNTVHKGFNTVQTSENIPTQVKDSNNFILSYSKHILYCRNLKYNNNTNNKSEKIGKNCVSLYTKFYDVLTLFIGNIHLYKILKHANYDIC